MKHIFSQTKKAKPRQKVVNVVITKQDVYIYQDTQNQMLRFTLSSH